MDFTLVRLVLSDITESATPISNVKSVTTCLLMHITIPLLGLMKHVLLSVTLIMPGDDYPLTDPWDIRETLEHELDLVIDGGYCGMEPTSVVQLTDDVPEITRRGKGCVAEFE